MKITICGSMSFAKEMLEVSRLLKDMGHEVILPVDTVESMKDSSLGQNVESGIRKDVIRDHLRRVRKSDAILVLNYEKNGIAGYIGASSLIEMAFAHYLNKKIYLLNPIPDISYAVEIRIMQPIVLKGDLKNLGKEV